MNIVNSLTNGDGDLWYLWVAFDITFLVLAIDIEGGSGRAYVARTTKRTASATGTRISRAK